MSKNQDIEKQIKELELLGSKNGYQEGTCRLNTLKRCSNIERWLGRYAG